MYNKPGSRRTDPFPQIATVPGQHRGPGQPVNRKPPGISPVRCSHYPLFHRHPRAAHTHPPPASVFDRAGSAARGWAPSRHRAARTTALYGSAGGGARRRSPVPHISWPTGIRRSPDASTADACSGGDCRGHLLPLTSPPAGDRMRDENNGQVPRSTRNKNAEAHILAELEDVDGEVRPDADLGAARGIPGADPRCADRR